MQIALYNTESCSLLERARVCCPRPKDYVEVGVSVEVTSIGTEVSFSVS